MSHITHLTLRLATLQVQRSMARIIHPETTRYEGQLAIHGANGKIVGNVSTGEGKGKTIAVPKGHAALTKSLHVARASAAQIHGEGHPIVKHLDHAITAADKVTANAKSGKASGTVPRSSKTPFVIPDDGLVPLKRVENNLSLGAAVDPYYLHELYGPQQLPKALQRYHLSQLLEAAAIVQSKHPGTKPANKSKKAAVIAYIVAKVTQ